MATKDEIEEELNEKLGLGIEWSQLKKDDLKEIRDGLEDEEFVKKFVAVHVNSKAGDMAQEQIEGWKPGQGLQMIAQLQSDEKNPMDFFM
jgi:hypothetical protein